MIEDSELNEHPYEPITEQDGVVPGEQGPRELGQDGPAEAEDTGPGIAARGQRGEQVVADLLAQVLVHVAGGTQFTSSEDIGAIAHPSKVVPDRGGNRGIFQISLLTV